MKTVALFLALAAAPLAAQEPPTPLPAEPVASPTPVPAPEKVDVNVVGAVAKPGRYFLPMAAGAVGALAAAGWFTDMADQKKVRLLRKSSDNGTATIILDVTAILAGKAEDPKLHAEDTFHVVQRLVNF